MPFLLCWFWPTYKWGERVVYITWMCILLLRIIVRLLFPFFFFFYCVCECVSVALNRMSAEAPALPPNTTNGDGSQRAHMEDDVVPAQRVRLEGEEEFSIRLWAARVQYMEMARMNGNLEGHHTPHGPVLPPGWYININDPVLLTYDPYFRSHAAKADAASAPLFSAKEGRYYAESALPLCRVEAHSLKSCPPAGDCLTDLNREALGNVSPCRTGNVVARRRIKAGEVIAMDVSELCVVEDTLVWRFFPRSSASCRKKKGGRSGKEEKGPIKRNGVRCTPETFSPEIVAAARQIVLHAHAIRNGVSTLVETGFAQLLASLLLWCGDIDLLPREEEVKTAFKSLETCGNFYIGPVTSSAALRQSQRVEAFIERWCAVPVESDPHFTALRGAAMLLLQCIPPALLSCAQKDPTEAGGCLSLQNGNAFVVPHYGFIRRMRLHSPDRLAQLLLGFSREAVPIHVPDLPARSGFFPFLRRVPHECRPNSFVMFLDSPASHCYGEAGFFDYNTTGRHLDGETRAEAPVSWGFPCSDRVFLPSVAVLVACRDINCGEHISRGLFQSVFMTQPQRSKIVRQLFGVPCSCRWCVEEPDVARAFRCPQCPRNCGVICPVGDGSRLKEWVCLQCGYRPDVNEVHRCLDEEQELARVKADKMSGLVRLLQADTVHYSHAIVFHKIDGWCQKAWQGQDASMCLEYLDVMQKSVHRVLDPCDPQVAQVHEFTAQVNHTVGSAHTARYEYFLALQIRLRAGMRYAHWTRKTWFMAAEKSLAEFLDSV
ncbi:hypothetical protein Tc00.1047053507641.220 [Trypanosoma cruzi]|uniref:SET domain-containing protein n=1 Tax=Trypanosoma cruzi (strain CL Brener) TaxID=353153 RepID=Q4DYQ3_TRYCC|nr:hypothetical protein Tc00.1047053507641.220 [Trypanosoma cruzi]EAN97646.1 hypothetical protein Tc00.1047053507641.220 [Trypanosoma cruzi]|eukprot:XP_819497.1 hypothetical protein [Trypanosoma cruzi strain CL Brener]